MSIVIVLAIILLLLLTVINGKRGIKAFFSLFANYLLVVCAAVLMCKGFSPVLMALIFSFAASAFILFFINGINSKTVIAYISIVCVLILVSVLIIGFGYHNRLNGFGGNLNDTLYLYSPNIPVDFSAVAVAVILISLTGAITDTALDISTSLHEVYMNNKNSTFVDLVKSGNNMGADIMGTMVNTLFFVFLGELTAFVIAYGRYHFGFSVMINDSLFFQEIAQLFIGNIGCILVIPATIFLQSYLYTAKKKLQLIKKHTEE